MAIPMDVSLVDISLKAPAPGNCTGDAFVTPGSRDMPVQFVLSALLGLSAFVGFCVSGLLVYSKTSQFEDCGLTAQFLRPRWKTLYAARTAHPNFSLPALPNTFFGWMPVLYRVSEEQVLAAAGLDAFVVSQSNETLDKTHTHLTI